MESYNWLAVQTGRLSIVKQEHQHRLNLSSGLVQLYWMQVQVILFLCAKNSDLV